MKLEVKVDMCVICDGYYVTIFGKDGSVTVVDCCPSEWEEYIEDSKRIGKLK